MKISSESILASSDVFWNRFRIVGPESVSIIDSGIGSGIGSEIGSEITPESESIPDLAPESKSESKSANLSQFRNLHRNRRLGSMMLSIDSRKK